MKLTSLFINQQTGVGISSTLDDYATVLHFAEASMIQEIIDLS